MKTISVIDNLTGGLQGPQVMLLAGRPGYGKTTFILKLAVNLARNDSVPVAIFSPSHTNAQLVLKIYSQYGMDSLKELPLYLDDTQFQTLEEFAGKVVRLVNEEGVKVVFIDRLEFFELPASLALVEQKALALQTFRQLADRFRITIVACERFRGIPDSRPIDLNEYERKGFPYEILKEYVDVAAVLNRPGLYEEEAL